MSGFNQVEYLKNRRASARAEGKCGTCFIRWARDGEFRCDRCAERHRDHSLAAWRLKHPLGDQRR